MEAAGEEEQREKPQDITSRVDESNIGLAFRQPRVVVCGHMTTREEEALVVARRIAQKEAEIAEAQASLASLKAKFSTFFVSEVPKSERPAIKAGGAPERALGVMRVSPRNEFSPSDVAKELADLDIRLVRTTMLRLANSGRIEKVDRGRYRLPATG